MIYTTLDNFYLTAEQLENSPSRKDGIDRDTENTLRIYGCELIQEGGVLLKFPQAAMATGQVLFHRFYCKKSMKDFNVKKLAATALWLGAKLEEVPEVSKHPEQLLRKVLVVFDRICIRREGQKLSILEPSSKDYTLFKEACIRYEREMLRSFGFITHVEHPHKLVLNYCQVMRLDKAHPEVLQEAWSLVNDSLRTMLCVRYRSNIIACGIIYYAAWRLKVPLPEQPPWWELFEVEEAGIYEVCRTMHELYLAPKAHHIPVYRNILPSKPGTPATPATHAKGFDGDTEPRVPVGRQLGPSPGAVLQAAVAAAAEAVRGEPPSASITPALQAGSEPAAAGEPQQQGDAAAALPPPPSPSGDATAGGEAGARSGSLSRGPRLGRRSPSRSPPQSERELKRRRSLSPVGGGSSLHHRDRSTSHLRDREHDREPLERARHHHGRHQHQHHRDRDRDRDRERGRERERSPVSRSRERDRDDRERVRERSDRGGRQRERGRLERSSAGGDGGRRRDGGSVGGREAARPAERQRRSPPEGSPEEGGRREAARPAEQQRRSQPEALPEEGGSRKRPISAAAAAQGDSDDEGGGLGGNGTFSDLPPGLAARLGGTQRGAEKGARGADGRDGSGSSQQRVGGGDKPRRLPPPPAADEERGAPASENGGAAAGGSPASSGMEGSGG